jgi:hypothetical protein
MRISTKAAPLLLALLVIAPMARAQAPRTDFIWARNTNGQHITLDGKLDEPAWSKAETKVIQYGVDNGYPGSGYKTEGGSLPNDQTSATLKFLVDGNYLYLGAVLNDKSIGGSVDFNREDGLLMMIMDHLSPNRPTPPLEHYYSWWYPLDTRGAATPGRGPAFRGAWATEPAGTPRTSTEVDNWNAVTIVKGLTNSDTTPDTSYTVEMQFNLVSDGYHPTDVGGDVVEWSLSIYDVDWYWPLTAPFSANRTWWQNPWGNTSWYDEVKIYTKPSVTIDTPNPLPDPGPDLRIPNGAGYPAPTIDGKLTEAVWSHVPSFDIRYGDTALRDSYPGVGKWRSGEFQPAVNGGLAPVLDPGDCTVKYFFLGNWLYLGFDVRDIAVQYYPLEDRWDGLEVTLNEKTARSATDHFYLTRRLAFQVGPDGKALKQYYLPFLVDTLGGAQVQISLNAGTVLDTAATVADNGYQAELAVDLTKLGFPSGLGDGSLLMGIMLHDGDSFIPYTDSYSTRTWWFRQYDGENGPAWCYLDPHLTLADVGPGGGGAPLRFALIGSQPNPFSKSAVVRYSMPEASDVSLEVYDLSGRRLRSQHLGMQSAGEQRAVVNRERLRPGLYVYRLRFTAPGGGAQRALLSGKMMLVD